MWRFVKTQSKVFVHKAKKHQIVWCTTKTRFDNALLQQVWCLGELTHPLPPYLQRSKNITQNLFLLKRRLLERVFEHARQCEALKPFMEQLRTYSLLLNISLDLDSMNHHLHPMWVRTGQQWTEVTNFEFSTCSSLSCFLGGRNWTVNHQNVTFILEKSWWFTNWWMGWWGM